MSNFVFSILAQAYGEGAYGGGVYSGGEGTTPGTSDPLADTGYWIMVAIATALVLVVAALVARFGKRHSKRK
jgi:hypothetical protein